MNEKKVQLSSSDRIFETLMLIFSHKYREVGYMEIVESMIKEIQVGDKTCKYEYMLTKGEVSLSYSSEIMNIQSYGIEVERRDFINGNLVNIDHDGVKNISSDRYKVHNLLKILYENIVSPINFVEIIGECIDEYTSDYDRVYNDILSC